MKLLGLLLLVVSFSTLAGTRVECVSDLHRLSVEKTSSNDLKVTFRGETVLADGLLDSEQVDLVAKFSSIGEMTLFAKIGKSSPENYMFIQGKRISVNCR